MKRLLLASPRGFCAGVIRAIGIVEKALEKHGVPIYVRHEIVHNRHVIEALKKRGVIFVEDLKMVPTGSVIIYSAHGVSPAIREEAKERNLIEIDATCVLVQKLHTIAKEYAKKGYRIIIIGHKKHVEVIGIQGEAPDQTVIVETVKDVENLSIEGKVACLVQTTFSLSDVEAILAALKEKYPHIEMGSSRVCYATEDRQKALQNIAQECELIYVVGDPKSSNSNRLKEVAERHNVKAFLINGPEEIDEKDLSSLKTIGMSAGASTPEDVVQSCVQKLRNLGYTVGGIKV